VIDDIDHLGNRRIRSVGEMTENQFRIGLVRVERAVKERLPQESSKIRDITGGLPRVADLFEARIPKEPAILAERTGTVSFGKESRTRQRLMIKTADGEVKEIPIPKWRHISVFDGQHVEKGEEVVDGTPNSHDILRLLGHCH